VLQTSDSWNEGDRQISDLQKFHLTANPNQQYIDWVPSRYEGRFAIVISAGWDAVDAEVPLTNGTEAYGEVVWS